jgi:hypothetical protein
MPGVVRRVSREVLPGAPPVPRAIVAGFFWACGHHSARRAITSSAPGCCAVMRSCRRIMQPAAARLQSRCPACCFAHEGAPGLAWPEVAACLECWGEAADR